MDCININNWLKETYGTVVSDKTLAKFKVSWTTNYTEKRCGTFEEYIPGTDIFLRSVSGVKEVLKYPYCQDRYVLEALCWIGDDKELVEHKYSYESIYIFQDKNQKFLPLNKRVIEVYIEFFNKRHLFTRDKVTRANELLDEQAYKDKVERDKLIQLIGQNQQIPHLMDLVE